MNRDGIGNAASPASGTMASMAIQWAADGRAVYAQYDDHGEPKVARIGLDGSVRDVAKGLSGGGLDRPYSGGSFSVSDGGAIAFTGGTATRPAEVQLVRGGSTRVLTDLNRSLREVKSLGEVRKITVASSHDGKTIEGWLTLPARLCRGPESAADPRNPRRPVRGLWPHFSTDNQLYAAGGYAVLSANPRGSTSYGAAFANEIDKAYPGNDYFDLISIVDRAIELGVADPDALFVTGGSGGGVLTSWIVGKTNRFKAAVRKSR
jgi:dipeptidyl aminopeptidase/acylaminoacyl peptidase